jgi:hypothetical protein
MAALWPYKKFLWRLRSGLPNLVADVHLRLTLAGVPAPRLQTHIAAHVATLRETMRVLQREQKRQCNQCAHALDLLPQLYLWITLLGEFFDAFVVFADLLADLLLRPTFYSEG